MGSASGLPVIRGRSVEELGLEVAVAEAADGKLATSDSSEQSAVIGERAEGTKTVTMPDGMGLETIDQFLEGGVVVYSGEGFEVALGGLSR